MQNTAQKKDKEKVIGVAVSEATLQAFLELEPFGDDNPDFHCLTKAYRGLPPHEFERFIDIYKAAGRPLNPANAHGVEFIDSISMNEAHQEYIAIMHSAAMN